MGGKAPVLGRSVPAALSELGSADCQGYWGYCFDTYIIISNLLQYLITDIVIGAIFLNSNILMNYTFRRMEYTTDLK